MRTSIGRLSAGWIVLAFLMGNLGGHAGPAWAGEAHHPAMPQKGSAMQHGTMEVGDAPAPPAVKLTIHKDAKAGWNLQVQVENLRFAPEHASGAHVAGEGHAHLYIDGKKVTRLYGEWYHIPSLSAGTHKITVSLNANSHEDYTFKGKPIFATQEIRVSAK